MKDKSAEVYYFIEKQIAACQNEEHIKICDRYINTARFYGHLFVGRLCELLQIRRIELVAKHYPVSEWGSYLV